MAKITPLDNGPIMVTGLEKAKTMSGETEVEAEIYLCRCGQSKSKPYCDGSHTAAEFSSVRETKRDLNKEHEFIGIDITIHDNRTICSHAAHCVNDLKTVFAKNERPWVNPDGDRIEAIKNLIERCPSGALSYTLNEEKKTDYNSEVEMEIVKDGPYNFKGPNQLDVKDELKPPTEDHFSLCRCGASKNKPYCDGNHMTIKFKAD